MKTDKLSELFKELIEKYKFYKFAYLDNTSTDLRADFDELENEISEYKAKWVQAVVEVQDDQN